MRRVASNEDTKSRYEEQVSTNSKRVEQNSSMETEIDSTREELRQSKLANNLEKQTNDSKIRELEASVLNVQKELKIPNADLSHHREVKGLTELRSRTKSSKITILSTIAMMKKTRKTTMKASMKKTPLGGTPSPQNAKAHLMQLMRLAASEAKIAMPR